MSYCYDTRKKPAAKEAALSAAAPAQHTDALRAGLTQPTAADKGRRVDLPEAMRTKMEGAFGADLSAVKLYESQSVADAGAEAVTRGSEIAFAPGMLDFSSYGGQALLGHELSHVVSQQRGEVTGSGFLNDRALEAQADREGALAAAGQPVAMPTAALSTASAAPAAGPMQAKKKGGEEAPKSASQRGMRREIELISEPRRWNDEKWGFWKRWKHNRKLTAKTGLSQKKEDILARMQADMDMAKPEDEEEE